jgi:7-carboxy-7-deazaguanine synthase
MTLQVNELFHSIQGESLWTGLPCSFVRMTGCNLRCRYCDTTYAYESGKPMRIRQIVQALARFHCRRVTITGGEPLIQHRTPELIQHLLSQDYRVSLETNGSQDIQYVDKGCMIVMDLKCPSSGMRQHNRMENLRCLKPSDQLKFVIADREDYLYAREIVKREGGHLSGDNILFSPAFGTMPPHRLAAWILDDDIEVRLQIQLHRILWPDRDKGV